jgi:hypothetical protein
MQTYLYIYNRHQANYFIENGLPVLEFGKGKKDGYYVKFLRDDTANAVFDKWINVKDEIMKSRTN